MNFTSVSCGIMIIIIIILRMLTYVILNPLALNDHMQKNFYIVVAKNIGRYTRISCFWPIQIDIVNKLLMVS